MRMILICLLLAAGLTLSPNEDVAAQDSSLGRDATSEILAKYHALNGVVDDAKVDLWDTYFLNHHLIGNTHDNESTIGWEAFHEAMIADKSLPDDQRPYAETYDLTVYPINENTAWVKGRLRIVMPPDRTVKESYFYDSLIRTSEGWRVFTSVVSSISGG